MRWRNRANHEESAAKRVHQLTASRRKIAEAYEVERLRIERDLHDGAQQYLSLINISEPTRPAA